MRIVGDLLCALIRFSGLAWLIRNTVARRRASIVLYHDPGPALFEEQVRYIADRYTLVSIGALAEAISSGRWAELPARPLAICFDDGRSGNLALAPTLAALAAPPALYLCTGIVGGSGGFWWDGLSAAELERAKAAPDAERRAAAELAEDRERWAAAPPEDTAAGSHAALTAEQVRGLAEHCAIGSHTRTHPILPRCGAAEAEEEVARSRQEAAALAGRPCLDFAYPAGAYGEREVRLVRAAGYRSARTVDVGWNGPGSDRYRLRLLSIDPPTTTRLAAELSGFKWLSRIVAGKGGLDGRRRFRGAG